MADNMKIVIEASDKASPAVAEINKGLGQLEQQALKMSGALNGAGSTIASVFNGLAPVIAGAGVGAALLSIANQATSLVGEMGRLAEEAGNLGTRLGMTAKQALELQGMADIAGVSIGSLQGAARLLADALEGTGNEGKKTYLALQNLGIMTVDSTGKTREMGVVLVDVIEHLAKIENAAIRTHTATALLGRASKEIMPLVAQYKELRDTVRELYGSVSDDVLQKLQAADDKLDIMALTWKRFKLELASKIEPILIPIIVGITKFVTGSGNAIDSHWSRLADEAKSKDAQQEAESVAAWKKFHPELTEYSDRTFDKEKKAKVNQSYVKGMATWKGFMANMGLPLSGIGPQDPNGGLGGSSYEVKQAIVPKFNDKAFKDAQELEAKILALQLDTTKKNFDYQINISEQTRETELRQLETFDNMTLAQKLGLETAKAEIEKRYQVQRLAATAALLEAEQQIELAKAGENAQLRAAIIEKYGVIGKQAMLSAQSEIDAAQQNAQVRQLQLIRDQAKQNFDRIKDSVGSLFDAMVSRTRSWGDVLKSVLNTFFLAPLKESFSTVMATLMTGGRQGSGSQSGGLSGILSGLFGNKGGGFIPGVTPGTTPPFIGSTSSVTAIPGMVGFGIGTNGQIVNSIGGKTSGLSSFLGGSIGLLGTKSAQSMFGQSGAFGKFGGAAQGAFLTGGMMLGMDGWNRGGWTGAAELAGGGASIGFALGGPVGAGIGAAIGGGIGIFRALFSKSQADKIIKQVKDMYGITIDKQFAKSLADQSKGMDLRVFLASSAVREQIQMYAQMTNQGSKMNTVDDRARGVFLSQSSGVLSQAGSYSGNTLYGYTSSLNSAAGLNTYSPNPQQTSTGGSIVLDKGGTKDFLTDLFVGGIVENPKAVQTASNSAITQNFGRTSASINLNDPLAARI